MKFCRFLILLLLCLALVLPFVSCAPEKEEDGRLHVVCTVFPLYDLAREIGGDRIRLTLLQENGADPHNYSATISTLKTLSEADVFLYVGGESDLTWVPSTLEAVSNPNLLALSLMQSVEPATPHQSCDWSEEHHEHDHDHEHGADEHVWTSLINADRICVAIKEALCQKDPDSSELYTASCERYRAQLSELDRQYQETVENASKDALVFADRFPFVYLMRDYQIPYFAAFTGCSTEIHTSFQTQVDLTRAVQEHGLSSVLVIEGNDEKALARAIAEQTGCRLLSLHSLQAVTRAEIDAGLTYLRVMQQNLDVIKEALS